MKGKPGSPWCDCERGLLLAMRRLGLSCKIISAHFLPGRSPKACVFQLHGLKSLGYETKPEVKRRRLAKFARPYIEAFKRRPSPPGEPGSRCCCRSGAAAIGDGMPVVGVTNRRG